MLSHLLGIKTVHLGQAWVSQKLLVVDVISFMCGWQDLTVIYMLWFTDHCGLSVHVKKKKFPQREKTSLQSRGVQTFGISGPHWKKKSCLGPHIKYIATCNHQKQNKTKSHNTLSKFMLLCWAAFIAILGLGLDTPAAKPGKYLLFFNSWIPPLILHVFRTIWG